VAPVAIVSPIKRGGRFGSCGTQIMILRTLTEHVKTDLCNNVFAKESILGSKTKKESFKMVNNQ
jgi:hypothetical protein